MHYLELNLKKKKLNAIRLWPKAHYIVGWKGAITSLLSKLKTKWIAFDGKMIFFTGSIYYYKIDRDYNGISTFFSTIK